MKVKPKEVQAGTTILTAKPFVFILNSKLRTERCDFCFAKTKLMKCSGCQYTHYCGRVCQKEGWFIHKMECPNIKRVAPRVVPDAARLLARLIIKLQKGGDREQGYYSEISFRKFKDLMSHYSDIKDDNMKLEHFTSLCGVLFEFLGETQIPNSAELMGMFGRMCVNGFNILDPEMISIGTGIYLAASIIDHSCKPNALAIFQGTTIHIRTLQNLPVLDWTKIFISYIDLLNTPEDRQKELQATYYFLCQCQMCLDPKQLKNMKSAACSNNKCDAQIDMCIDEENMRCEKCNAKVSEEFKVTYRNVVEFTLLQLEGMKNMAYVDICKMLLKKQESVLHPLNLLYVKTLDLAFDSSVQIGNWDDAEEFGKQLVSGFRHYYGDIHPLLGLLNLKIAKILLYRNKQNETIDYLREARNILKITHGEQHTLFKESVTPLLMQCAIQNGF